MTTLVSMVCSYAGPQRLGADGESLKFTNFGLDLDLIYLQTKDSAQNGRSAEQGMKTSHHCSLQQVVLIGITHEFSSMREEDCRGGGCHCAGGGCHSCSFLLPSLLE
jgi:hypothetical protein